MVDVVSIVVAVVSLVGSLVAAGFTGWISFYIDSVKRKAEAKALTDKYRDPLTLSAYELQSRLFGLVQTKLLTYLDDENKRELVQEYTCYLVGQYFSWVYIFRRQAQFLRFSTDQTSKNLNKIMVSISIEFSKDIPGQSAFTLWRGQQMAIGELMTKTEGGEQTGQMYCMGYAEFSAKYKDENHPAFKKWFRSIDDSIVILAQARAENNPEADSKVRRLQHLLIDLVLLLDEETIQSSGFKEPKVKRAATCDCKACPGREPESPSVAPKRRWDSRKGDETSGGKV